MKTPMMEKKKMVSMTKEMNSEKETFTLKKRTETEEVSKTLEKISNGWLLTVDKYPFEGEYSCVKKYFEKNPLEMEDEEETEVEDDKMEGGDFKENWDILSL